jgi:uncharacterized protein YeaO (DUF488 family)
MIHIGAKNLKRDITKNYLEGQEVIVDILKKINEMKSVTLVYAAKDEKHNNAVVLRDYLLKKLKA